jgi:hypothetical protein
MTTEPDTLAEIMAGEIDLSRVQAALVRETTIRQVMAQSGEGRQTVEDMINAMESMDQEAVLDLTEGEPTTLRDALLRYVRVLDERDPDGDELTPVAGVSGDLGAILNYPWSDEEERLALHNPHYGLALHIEYPDDDHVEIRIGSNRWLVASGDYDELGRSGMAALGRVAEAVHRAVLVRVIADREHIVSINPRDRLDFLRFVDRPSGSWAAKDSRITVDAVAGGGLLIRTRPFSYQADSQLSKLV